MTLDSTALGRSDNRDMGLEAGPRPPSFLAHSEIADKIDSLESPQELWDCSSDASFVTAVEASGAEDPARHTSWWAVSLPQTKQQLLPGVQPSERMPRSPGTPQQAHGAVMAFKEAELNARLQALTLTLPDASPNAISLPDASLAHSPPQEPLPGSSNFHFLKDDQVSFESDVATLWLTEDEASSTGGKDPFPSCRCLPDPTISDLELPQGLWALGKSPGPITPSTRQHHLRRLEESQAAPG